VKTKLVDLSFMHGECTKLREIFNYDFNVNRPKGHNL